MNIFKKINDYFDFISESLNSPKDIDWKIIDGNLIGFFEVNSVLYRIECLMQIGNNYSFSFSWNNNGIWEYNITNFERGAFYVLSTIISGIEYLYNQYKPNSIIFSAIDESSTRKRLYKQYCDSFCKKTNYKLIDRGNEKFIMYVIYNENISDSEKEDIFNSIQKIIEDGK
jgi:hypothetical protein